MAIASRSGTYEGSSRVGASTELSGVQVSEGTFAPPTSSEHSEGILPAGIYLSEGDASIYSYANASGFPISFRAEVGYESSLTLRPLSVPDTGSTLSLSAIAALALFGWGGVQRRACAKVKADAAFSALHAAT